MAALLVLVSGCATADGAGNGQTSPGAGLPDGVTVEVYQSRSDVVVRALQVRIVNGSDEDLEITGAEFVSPGFASPAVWQKDSTVVVAGRTVDLPVSLSDSVCVDGEPEPRVALSWSAGGDLRRAEVTPVDERGRLGELGEEACFDQAVASVSAVSAETPPRSATVGGLPAIELDVTFSPTSTAGSLMLASVSGTTLFTPVDRATGAELSSLPLGIVTGGDRPTVVTLLLVPTRCDPHAVAEDKQGTIFPFAVDAPAGAESGAGSAAASGAGVGTVTGTVFVATPTAVKEALIASVAPICAARGEG
ncbi:MAG: hypothetical protein RI885_1411 [Actinomycetota bacterium]